MTLSIVIVSYNVSELLKKCLTSIYKNRPSFDFEVFVVDNNSADDSVQMVRTYFPQVTLITNRENAGFAKANNQAIKQSKGDYVLLLNPDTEIVGSTLDRSARFMKEHVNCGVMGCKLLNSDLSVQESVRRFPTLASQATILLKLHHFFPDLDVIKHYLAKDFDYEKTQEVDQVMGAYFLIPRKVIDDIGMLDEGYFIWFEEVDYCLQVKKAGYRVMYYPGAKTVHHESKSFAQVMSVPKQRMWNKSIRYYFKKNHGLFARFSISVLAYISLILAKIHQFFVSKKT